MAIDKQTRAEILRLFFAEKWKIGTIARQLGVHHNTVDRIVADAGVPLQLRGRKPSKLDPFLPFIRETLAVWPRLPSSRLYRMVVERGYRGSQSHFRNLIAPERPRPVAEAYLRLKALPGEQAQVDWAHFGKVRIGRAERPLMGFVMVLGHSRRIFLRFYLNAGMDNFLRGHVEAFEAWQGVPRELWYDNLKSVVLERHGDAIRFNPRLLDFAGAYRFLPKPVAVARGNEKGRVERAIRYVRDSFFAARAWRDLDDLNAQAREWCEGIAADRPWPDDRSLTVREAFERERGSLLALPGDSFPVDERVEVRIGKTPYARFDKLCRYRHRRSHAANRTMPRQWRNPLIWNAFRLGFAAYSRARAGSALRELSDFHKPQPLTRQTSIPDARSGFLHGEIAPFTTRGRSEPCRQVLNTNNPVRRAGPAGWSLTVTPIWSNSAGRITPRTRSRGTSVQ